MKITLAATVGIKPRTAAHLLSETEAQVAENVRAEKGDMRGWKAPIIITSLTGTAYKALLKYVENSTEHWVTSTNALNWVKSPIAQDAYCRLYYTGESEPRVFADTLVSSPFSASTDYYKWGVVAPTTAPTVAGSGSLTRYYFYTFENAFGEEGPGSPIGGGTSVAASPVGISDLPASDAALISGRQITKINLYRTGSGTAGKAYYFYVLTATWFDASTAYAVGDFVLYGATAAKTLYKCTSTHAAGAWNAGHFTAGDDVSDATLTAEDVCESETYEPPPSGMKGAVMTSNGIVAGYVGNQIYFSEPFLPHAFPSGYSQSIEEDVVALGAFGESVAILTEGVPYVATGTAPEQMTIPKVGSDKKPCLSALGVVTGKDGVIYPSKEGLIRIDAGGANNISFPWLTPTEWAEYYPDTIRAVYYAGKYIGFYSYAGVSGGFILDLDNNTFIDLDFYAQAAFVDTAGTLYLIMDDESTASPKPQCIKEWEGDPYNHLYWRVRSKKYLLPGNINFSCARVQIDLAYYNAVIELMEDAGYLASENAALFAASFATVTGDHATFTGQANDKIKVIIDGTTYDNISISACTTTAAVAAAINAATGHTQASTDSDDYLVITGNIHVEIADGTTSGQTVVAELVTDAADRTATAVPLGSAINESEFNLYEINGDSLKGLNTVNISTSVIFKLYADDELKFTKTVTDGEIFRLPGGYLSRNVEIQVEGYIPVLMAEIATSVMEMLAA